MSKRTRVRIILIIVLLVIAFLVVCYPDTMTVSGNVHNGDAEILTMVQEDPLAFNSVLLYLKNKLLPLRPEGFIEEIDIELEGPRNVRINVNERGFAGHFKSDGTYWYFDRDGVVRAASSKPDEEYGTDNPIPFVTGFNLSSVGIGEVLPKADTGVYGNLYSFINVLGREGLYADEIRIEDGNVTAVFGDVRVMLGDLSFLEEKVGKIKSILPGTGGMSGVLHLENYDGNAEGIVFDQDK